MAHFIYFLKLNSPFDKQENWTDATNDTLNEHWAYLVELHKKGVVKIVGRTDVPIDLPINTGIAIFTAENEQEAMDIMNNDPCIIQGVMNGTVAPFNFALGA